MLKSLSIKNFAIISNAEVSFEDGFTVLTGQTGAGKSLVIDSLSLLLGARAASELIRTGEDKASVLGQFEIDSKKIDSILSKYEVPSLGKDLKIERIISRNRNIVKINDVTVSLNVLQELAPKLANIHDQFDFYKILNPDNYLELIDSFDINLIEPLKLTYQDSLDKYRKIKGELSALVSEANRIRENKDFYDYQFKELSNANLLPNEDKAITEELLTLRNFDKIHSLSLEAKQLINGNSLDDLYELVTLMKSISKVSPSYLDSYQNLEDKYFELNDICSDIKKSLDSLDFDPNHLEELNERDAELSRLKRKYKKSLDELISYRDHLKLLLANESDIDIRIEKIQKEVEKARLICLENALSLQNARKKVAKVIEKKLESSLKDLLLDAKFSIVFIQDELEFKDSGIDAVDFFIETNKGEGLKSLSKVVSGGEASRIMLAFKEIYVEANKVPTVIFDEIDTGLSGEAAEAVARKIDRISSSSQVIAITHLPQVAAKSNHHILISKIEIDGRTFTKIKKLDDKEKVIEIAKLVSNGPLTQKQIDYVNELISNNK